MIIWFRDQIVPSSFSCYKFSGSMFSQFLDKRSMFSHILHKNQKGFWLNLTISWRFFKTSPWFNACFIHFFHVISFEKIYFITFFIILFYEIFISWEVSLIRSKLFTESICDIVQPFRLFTSQYWICNSSL